ncbi:MAG: hotdog fold thioesterase [Saprospiraceae bacterium]
MVESVFKYLPTPEQLNERGEDSLAQHLGIEFVEVTQEYLKAKMPVDHRTKQPMGILHGGASAAFAETLGSIASLLCIDKPNNYPVGIEINVNHLKSVSEGYVTGIVKPIRIGRTIHVWSIEIFNEANEMTAISRLTVMLTSK